MNESSEETVIELFINTIPKLHAVQFRPIDVADLFGDIQAFIFVYSFIDSIQCYWFPLGWRNGIVVWITRSCKCRECFAHSIDRFPFVRIP